MSNFDKYVFILCLIVFGLFVILFTYLIGSLAKSEVKMIRHGLLDSKIKLEALRKKNKNSAFTAISKAISFFFCLVLGVAFAFSLYLNFNEDKPANGIPSIKVVKSNSMATKNEKNLYLFENNLNNQFDTFDIVICHHLPKEEDLKLYDIVIYKQDDIYVIHRIVGIEEPNEKHPNERHFLLQGDAVSSPDRFPVLYSQMQGIYTGDRIPYAGSFILFLQSPAGWLCILLVIYAIIATPLIEIKIEGATYLRLNTLEKEEKKKISK